MRAIRPRLISSKYYGSFSNVSLIPESSRPVPDLVYSSKRNVVEKIVAGLSVVNLLAGRVVVVALWHPEPLGFRLSGRLSEIAGLSWRLESLTVWSAIFKTARASFHPGSSLEFLITVAARLLELTSMKFSSAWADRLPASIL